jgi:lactoylglutathione lyase
VVEKLVVVEAVVLREIFYGRMLGLRPLWRDEVPVGMGLPETDAEVVYHTMDLPPESAVHYLVDDVLASVTSWRAAGLKVRRQDPFGNSVCILDVSKGLRLGRPG